MLLLVKFFYCSLQLSLGCSFLFNLLLHDLNSSHNGPSSGDVLLHEPHALILLAKARQLIFDDCFNFFLGVLLLVLLDFHALVLLRGWRQSV
jgi:hypothetical protein